MSAKLAFWQPGASLIFRRVLSKSSNFDEEFICGGGVDKLEPCCYSAAINGAYFMSVKRITIRVSPKLHEQLIDLAQASSKSLNTVAVEALESFAASQTEEAVPLQQLSYLLSPVADAEQISEEELLAHARVIRERIWHERYAERIQALEPQSA
jgi:CRISPR/Cas system-associated protein Csm6